jgi:hypothetical protein
MTVTNANPA